MMDKVLIRSETSADVSAIAEVTVAAFKTLAISNHTEQFIIAALRAAKALTVSLVAEVDGRVVGHIAFSPVMISDGSPNWYGLGPVSGDGATGVGPSQPLGITNEHLKKWPYSRLRTAFLALKSLF